MTALTPIFVIVYSVVRGRPKKFIMIKKANDVMKLSGSAPNRADRVTRDVAVSSD